MKLIASDLDGTLLNERSEISTENAEAIHQALAQGIEFVVATGRSYEAANIPLKKAGLSAPVISLNGALTYSLDQQVLRSVPMDQALARKLQLLCEEAGIYFELFTNNGVYSKSREHFLEVMIDIMKSANPNLSEAEIREGARQRFQAENVQFIGDYDDVFQMDGVQIYKILGFSMNPRKLADIRASLQDERELAVTSSGDINIEFNHPDAQKGIALDIFAKSKGIEMKDVMALGDNFNDASMLQMAGLGVAMGNAAEEIKAMCDAATKANDEHGVAVAIEEKLKELNMKE